MFHFANAFEEKNGEIVIVGSRLPTINFLKFEDNTQKNDKRPAGTIEKGVMYVWKLDVKRGVCTAEFPIGEDNCDFLQINPTQLGKKSNFVYASRFTGKGNTPKVYENSLFLIDALLKYDVSSGKLVKTMPYVFGGSQMYGSEAVFAQTKSQVKKSAGEDDGYLITVIHNEETQKSQVIILKAKDLSVQCRIALNQRVPYG